MKTFTTPYEALLYERVRALLDAGIDPAEDEGRAVQALYAAGVGLTPFHDKVTALDDIQLVFADLTTSHNLRRAA